MKSFDIQLVRSLFPHTQSGHIYLNHAAISPLSVPVINAVQNFLSERHTGGIEQFESWVQQSEETRELIARLIQTPSPERITYMGNTSDGLSAVAEGLDWKKGDEILLNRLEFPSNVQPFRILERKGVRLRFLEPDSNGHISPESVDKAITPNTRLFSISAVQYLTGFRANLEKLGEVCNQHGVFFVVDAIQALGGLRIHVQKSRIDALATGGHKWLMAPMGTGFLYLSEMLASQLKPAKTGWLSVQNPWELTNYNQEWASVSSHLETGTLNFMGIIGLKASLELLFDIGTETAEQQILACTGHLFNRLSSEQRASLLSPADIPSRSGIVSFTLAGLDATDEVINTLKNDNITISAREGFFRISPHYYNTISELDTVTDKLLSL